MKENRNAIYVTLVITTVALGLAIVFEYNETERVASKSRLYY